MTTETTERARLITEIVALARTKSTEAERRLRTELGLLETARLREELSTRVAAHAAEAEKEKRKQ